MQRIILVAASALALTACSTMHDMGGHHASYAKLGKIAKEHDAQQALLLTRAGKLMVVNVATGEIVRPNEKPKTPPAEDQRANEVSEEQFAEIQRKFERTIDVKVTKGSVCIEFAAQPPGDLFQICSPPEPQWW